MKKIIVHKAHFDDPMSFCGINCWWLDNQCWTLNWKGVTCKRCLKARKK